MAVESTEHRALSPDTLQAIEVERTDALTRLSYDLYLQEQMPWRQRHSTMMRFAHYCRLPCRSQSHNQRLRLLSLRIRCRHLNMQLIAAAAKGDTVSALTTPI